MSYIQHLEFIQKSTSIDLNHISKGDIIKIEKLLKARQQLNDNALNNSTANFIKSLDSHQKGITFLLENPNLIAILTNSVFFKLNKDIIYNSEDEPSITSFFSDCLEHDLIECCNLAFSKGKYGVVAALLNYREFLPETVIHLIETKTETKLDYYLSIADQITEDLSLLSNPFIELVKAIDVERFNYKKQQLLSLTTSYATKAVGRSGLAHFFYVMTTGLSWMGREPETLKEKIEKREVLKDFKFMSKLLGAIALLFISVIMYKSCEDTEREQIHKKAEILKFKQSVYGYLTEYDSTEIANVSNWQKLASGPLDFHYFKQPAYSSSMSRSVTIINNSNYEILILPDKDLMSQFQLQQNTYYISPSDSIQASVLFSRLYIGKQLALFDTASKDETINRFHDTYRSRNFPRFLHPISASKTLIDKRFEFGKHIELIERNDSLLLETDSGFFVNSARYKSYPLEK